MFKPVRWGDNDHYFGPFTFSWCSEHYRPIGLILKSGDNDEYPDCYAMIELYWFVFILKLPQIIRPKKELVRSSVKDPVTNHPKYSYTDYHPREYGFSYYDGFLRAFYGEQTGSSDTTKDWGTHLSWTQWRFISTKTYGFSGEVVLTQKDTFTPCVPHVEATKYTRTFLFSDFDGERLVAHTVIKESIFQFGIGSFKWLSFFTKPKITRSLEIEFSGEMGRKKGGYKGGTLGHGIEMRSGETHEEAFTRYCQLQNLTLDTSVNCLADDEARLVGRDVVVERDIKDKHIKLTEFDIIAKDLGFVFLYGGFSKSQRSFSDLNLCLIYGHLAYGAFLRVDLYNNNSEILQADLYYNWSPKIQPHGISMRAVDKGYMTEDGIWIGWHRGVVGLRKTMALLLQDGSFVTPWKGVPKHMRFYHLEENNNGVNRESRNAELIDRMLPAWVKEAIGMQLTQ